MVPLSCQVAQDRLLPNGRLPQVPLLHEGLSLSLSLSLSTLQLRYYRTGQCIEPAPKELTH
eukprot:COSAG03_NODE_20785_length_313_cov_14.205607_1_plen_60_part_01